VLHDVCNVYIGFIKIVEFNVNFKSVYVKGSCSCLLITLAVNDI
jgi:hypothetical protein